jgi:hypothetical protein
MDQLDNRGVSAAYTSGALTAAGAVTTHDTTISILYANRGRIFTKTAITTGATPTTDGNTGLAITLTANQARAVVWALSQAGAVSVYAGPAVPQSGGAYLEQAPQLPAIPDSVTPFAVQYLEAGSTAGTITFGTSNWNATGFTNTIHNVSTLPDRPAAP